MNTIDNCITNEEDERRNFFRIEDDSILQYRLMPHETEESIQKKPPQHSTNGLTVGAKFAVITREMSPLLNTINNKSPQLAKYLSAIDQKLDILAGLLLEEEKDSIAQPPQKVNISAGGISFYAESPIPVGSILELRLILLPSNTGIHSYSKVVYCERDNMDISLRKSPYKIATEFVAMNDDDRDLISRHVLCKEAASLRSKKKPKLSTLS